MKQLCICIVQLPKTLKFQPNARQLAIRAMSVMICTSAVDDMSAITVCYECYTCFTTAASVTCSIIFYISVKLFLNLNISTHLLLPKNLFSIYWLLKLKHAKS